MAHKLNEQIAAAYWSAGFQHPCDRAPFKYRGVKYLKDDVKYQYRPVLFGDWSGGTNPELSCESYSDWDDIKLILTPLNKISDADAIEVAKIACAFDSDKHDWKLEIGERNENGISIQVASNWVIKIYDGHTITAEMCAGLYMPVLNIYGITDFLRSKAYDCGYMHIPSLIQAGIAVDKTLIK